MTAVPAATAARSSAPHGAWRAVLSALAEDRLFYILIGAHMAVAAALWALFSDRVGAAFLSYVGLWLMPAAWLVLACGVLASAGAVLLERPASPLSAWLGKAAGLCTPRLLANLAAFAALAFFMGAFTTIKTLLPYLHPYSFDPALADLDRLIHFGHDPWALLQPLLGRPPITRAVEAGYHGLWTAILALCPLAVCILCKDRILRTRFLLAFVLAWILYGNLLAGAVMSGGPAFYGRLTGDVERFAPMLDYLRAASPGAFSAARAQDHLWAAYEAGRSGLGLGISAFPTLHVTISCLLAFLAWRIHRGLGWLAIAFVGFTAVGSVHLGWHYAVESYFVFLAAPPLWWLAGVLARREHRRSCRGPG